MHAFRSSLLGLALLLLITPSIAMAYVKVSYVGTVSIDASTREALEQQCRKEVGLNETETGSLLFKVRRCIRTYEQEQEHIQEAARRSHRRESRQSKKAARSTVLKNQTERYRLRLVNQNRNILIRQTQNVKRTNSTVSRSIRSNSRRAVRDRERVIQLQRRQRATTRKEAGKLCDHYSGTQRIMCVREKIREVQRR